MKPRFRIVRCGALFVTFLTFTATSLRAADRYWDGTDITADADGGAGAWTTGGLNWDDLATGGTNAAWVDGDSAIFGTTTAAVGVTISSAVNASGITFNTTGYTVSGGSLTLSSPATINAVANASITSPLSATTTTVTKTGAGQLTLGGTNLHTGITTISAGTLRTTSGTALGAETSGTIVTSGATLDTAGQNLLGETITASGTGVGGIGAIVNNSVTAQQQTLRNVTLAGDTTVGGTARWDIRKPAALTSTIDMGGFTLTKTGTTDFHITGATVTNPGKIVVAATQFWLEDVTLLSGTAAANSLTIKTGTEFHQWNNNQAHVWTMNFEAGTIWDVGSGTNRWDGPITIAGNTTLQGGNAIVGIAANVISGAGKLIKGGANATNRFTLLGASTYSGGTEVNGGILQLGDTIATDYGIPGRIRGTVTVNTAGTLLLQGRNTLGYGAGVKVDNLFINGGTVTHAGNGEHGWGIAHTMTGGLLQVTGAGNIALGGIAGNPTGSSITTLATTAPATITGAINLRDGNPGNTVPFTTADGSPVNDLIVNSNMSSTVTGITKAGPGTMFYNGAGTYSGGTIINEGRYVLSPAATLTLSPVTVGANGTFVSQSSGKTLTSLTTASGARLVLPAATGATTTVTGTALLDGATVNVSPVIGAGGVGTTYDLLTAGTLTANATPTLDLTGAYGPTRATGNLSIVGNVLKFTLTGAGANLTWNNASAAGVANGTWDGTLANFNNSATLLDEAFQAFDAVTFNDTPLAGTAKVITVAGNRAPVSITVANATSPYTFTALTNGEGQLTGAGSLSKTGASTLTLGANLSYAMTGGISITGGTLDLGGKTLPNQASLTVNGTTTTLSNGTLATNAISADSGTISATVNGTGALTKNTADTLTLTGNSGYTGGTTVTAGKLQVGTGGTTGLAGTGGTTSLAAGTTFELHRSDSPTLSNGFTGAGQLIFRGTNLGGTAATASSFGLTGNSSALTAANQVSIISSRLALDNVNDIGLATLTNSGNGQIWAAGITAGNNAVITGDGWGEPTGPFGAMRLANTTWNGSITLAGNSRISTNGGGTVFSNINGAISDGPSDFNLTLGIAAAVSNFNLNGANTYTGLTIVQNSNVNVNGSLTSTTSVDATSTLGGTGTITGNLVFLTTGKLGVNVGQSSPLKVNGNVTLSSPTSVALNVAAPLTPGGSIPVLNYTGTLSGTTANLAMANPTNYRNAVFTIDELAVPKLISVNLGSKAVTWTGVGGTTWNIGTTTNWRDAVPAATAFFQADEVLFDDSGTAANSTIALSGLVQPSKVTFNNTTAVPYSFTGAAGNGITGGASLVKNGNGPVTFATPNAYTGPTTVNGGTLTYATGSTFANTATNTITVNSGATFAMNKLDLFAGHNTVINVPLVINGGTISTTSHNAISTVSMNAGTLVSTSGNDATYQSFALKGQVTVTGNATSTIASSGTNSGIHLGTGAVLGTTFDVADGTDPVDLLASASFRNGITPTGSLPQASSLTKNGTGTMVLTGVNSYTGVTNINAGVLQVGNGGGGGSLGTGAIVNNTSLVFNRDASGDLTVTAAISGTGTLLQAGVGTTILSGANTYTGNTTVDNGILSVTNPNLDDNSTIRVAATGVLNLNYTGTDDVKVLFLNGQAQVAGTWGSLASGATHKTARITGDGILNVLTTGSDPYGDWATQKGLVGADRAVDKNPDDDGLNNLGEFAFDGNPRSGMRDGNIVQKIVDIGGLKVLTLTLPIRNDTLFNVPSSTAMISSPKDGLVYRIEGSTTFGTFPLQITEITPAITANVTPASTGWTLRTFRTPGNTAADPKQFIRAKVTQQP